MYESLGININNLDDLVLAIETHRIQGLKGFGHKTEERLAEEIRKQTGSPKRLKLYTAEQLAGPLVRYLQETPGIQQVIIAGSYRRRRETVGDVDILVTCSKETPVMERCHL